MSTVTSP